MAMKENRLMNIPVVAPVQEYANFYHFAWITHQNKIIPSRILKLIQGY